MSLDLSSEFMLVSVSFWHAPIILWNVAYFLPQEEVAMFTF